MALNNALRIFRMIIQPNPVSLALLGLLSCEYPLESHYQNASDALSPTYVPVGPDSLSIVIHSDSLFTVHWIDRSLGEDGFKLFRKSEVDSNFAFLGTIARDSDSYRDSQLKVPGAVYAYRLYSYKGERLSSSFSEGRVQFTMSPPTLVSTEGSDSNRVTLRWISTIPFPTSSVIERSENQYFHTVAITPPGTYSFTDSSVDKFHIYRYRITSKTQHYASNTSDIVQCAFQIVGISQTRVIGTGLTPTSGQRAALSEDGHLLLSVGEIEATLVEFPSGQILRTIIFPKVIGIVNDATLSRNNNTFAISGYHDWAVFVYRILDGKLLRTIRGPGPGVDVALTDDASLVIASFGSGDIQCWRIADSTLMWERHLPSGITSLWLHPDGKQLLTGNENGCLLMDVQTGETLVSSIGGLFAKTPHISSNGDILIIELITGVCFNVTQGRKEFSTGQSVGSYWISSDGLYVALAVSYEHTRLLNLLTGTTIPAASSLFGDHNYSRMLDHDQQLIIQNQEGDVGVWKILYNWSLF